MGLAVGRHVGRTTGPVQWGQNEKTPAPGSRRASRVRDVFVVGGATAVGYRCLSDSKSRANRRQGRGQPSSSCMEMICSATWISFCCRLMAWRRIRV